MTLCLERMRDNQDYFRHIKKNTVNSLLVGRYFGEIFHNENLLDRKCHEGSKGHEPVIRQKGGSEKKLH